MKKLIITITILATLAMAAIPVRHVYATSNNWQNLIYPRVYIDDLNVSGKSLVEAEELLEDKYGKPLIAKKIEIEVEGTSYSLDYSSLDARYNIDEVVEEAFSYGKLGNTMEKYKLINGEEKKEYKLGFTYNSKPIDELLDTIEGKLKKAAVNAKISITNGNIKITPEVNGVKLQREELRKMIIAQINGELSEESIKIKAPLNVS